MIKKGIIKQPEIYGTQFLVNLVPKQNKTSRPSLHMEPKSITVHETDNEKQSADARMHTKYVDNTRNYVSWHFTVDDSVIIQELPIIENAWHAGDGAKGTGNRTSVAIEICVNKDGDFEKAKLNAIKLIKFLQFNTDLKVVFPHNYWTGKNCPRNILKSGWDKFLNKVEKYNPFINVPEWAVESWQWAKSNNINDGILQNDFELQVVEMLYRYDKLKGGK